MKILLNSKASIDEAPAIFEAFMTQEELYMCPDFLSETHQIELMSKASTNPYLIPTPLHEVQPGHSCESLTAEMRELVVEWKYRIVDSCDISRELVVQSTHNLDRYISLCPVSTWSYQLASVTSLYIVAKVHRCHERLSLDYFLALSAGRFTAKNVQDMERNMLMALNWRINPPVPILQSTYLIFVALPKIATKRLLILDLTRFLTEVILSDYYFVSVKPSTISVAAVFTAISIAGDSAMSRTASRQFACDVSKLTKLDVFSDDICACMDRMKDVFRKGEFNLAQFEYDIDVVGTRSPTSIMDFC